MSAVNKFYFSVSVFLFSIFIFHGRVAAIDSTGVASKVEILLKKSRQSQGNPDSILIYGKQAMELSQKFNYKFGTGEAYNVIGYGYSSGGDSYKAIEIFKQGIEFTRKNALTKTLSSIYINKGLAEESVGNYVTALDDYLQSIKLKQEINDSLGIAKCLNNIAQVYSRQGELDKALEYFFKSLDIKEKFDDKMGMGKTYNNIAVIYTDLKKYTESLFYLDKSLDLYKEAGSEEAFGTTYVNMARAYDLMGMKDTALFYYKKAMGYIQKNEDYFDMAVNSINIGSLYLDIKDYQNAKKYLEQGLEIANRINSKEDQKEAYKYLAQLFSLQKDYRKAFEMQQKFQVVSDSILNEENSAVLTEMHIKYETSKKDEENRYLTKENELQKAILERNSYITWGLAVFSVLIIAIAILTIQQVRLRNRQVTIELEQKILRSQMNPHFIFNSLQSIQGYIFEKNALAAGKYLSDFSRLIRLILENSFYEKIPINTEIETLTYYLSLQKMRFSDKLNYHLDIDPSVGTDQFEVPPMLLQPFIENSIEHGIKPREGAGNILIKISLKGDLINFTLEDDGIGREASGKLPGRETHKSRALSITGERMKLFNRKSNRKMSIEYTDLESPSGTRVEIIIPV